MPQYYQNETVMTKQSKKAITITPVRKATEEELKGIKVPEEGKPYLRVVAGITHLPENEGKGRSWFPTHDFEVIKKHREHLFYTCIQPEFLNESRIMRLTTTSKDLEDLRRSWLNDELKEIDRLMNNPQVSRRNRIELNKYLDYVQSELSTITEAIATDQIKQEGLSCGQVALIIAYEDKGIVTRDKGKLYAMYLKYRKPSLRMAEEDTKRKTRNKIDLIESIIPHLSQSAQQTANKELASLKTKLEQLFE